MAKKLDRLFIRVDANFPSDEKFQALPYKIRDSAYLFFEALNGWSRDKKTDGRVPLPIARSKGGEMEHPPAKVGAFIAALVDVGLLVPDGGDLLIPRYSKWQDTKDEIEERSEVRREAGRRGGEASGRSRREASASANGSSGEARAEANAKQNEAETETETVVASYEATGPAPSAPDRADVDQLCEALAESVAARGAKRPTVTAEWRREARRLLDLDHRPLAEALDLIAWSSADSFWRAIVLSMPKLREKYDQLRLQRGRSATPTQAAAGPPPQRHEIPPEDSEQMRAWMVQGRGGVQ